MSASSTRRPWAPPRHEDIPVETNVDGNTVIVTRWTNDSEPIPIFKKLASFAGNVDRWQFYYCYTPAICVVDFGSVDAGTSHDDADLDKGVRIYSCHFLTPETEGTTHYFWMQVRNFSPDDDALSDTITEQFIMAFDEDKEILEAVQAAEERNPPASVKLAIDNGPNRARRIVAKRIREEEAGASAAHEAAE